MFKITQMKTYTWEQCEKLSVDIFFVLVYFSFTILHFLVTGCCKFMRHMNALMYWKTLIKKNTQKPRRVTPNAMKQYEVTV